MAKQEKVTKKAAVKKEPKKQNIIEYMSSLELQVVSLRNANEKLENEKALLEIREKVAEQKKKERLKNISVLEIQLEETARIASRWHKWFFVSLSFNILLLLLFLVLCKVYIFAA